MYKAKVMTAYVHAMHFEKNAVIAGSFHIQGETISYQGKIFFDKIGISVTDGSITLKIALPDHITEGIEDIGLKMLVDLPLCGDEAIDREMSSIIIQTAKKSIDEEDWVIKFGLSETQPTHTVSMMKKKRPE